MNRMTHYCGRSSGAIGDKGGSDDKGVTNRTRMSQMKIKITPHTKGRWIRVGEEVPGFV